jgi:hypothetical protein
VPFDGLPGERAKTARETKVILDQQKFLATQVKEKKVPRTLTLVVRN